MHVVVVGASGNVGTSLLEALAREPRVHSVLGLARRVPEVSFPKTEWAAADIRTDDLVSRFRGAGAVVNLAWAIQPSHDLEAVRRTNVVGSARVFRAVAEAGVPALVHASSVGVYSPGPKDRRVNETWPREGVPTSFYARHKAEAERLLDRFEQEQPAVRVVRMRPGLIFKRRAATGIRRLFVGPLLPSALFRRLPGVVPDVPGLRFQAVHSFDVGQAYRLAVVERAHGAFNLVAEPPLDGPELARIFGARRVPLPAGILRGAAGLSWRLRLQPSPAGWVDLGLGVPLLDATRARTELGWTPRHSAEEAVLELVAGLGEDAGLQTPPLSGGSSGPGRARELATGIGGRDDADDRAPDGH